MVFKALVDWDSEIDTVRKLGLEGKTFKEIAAVYGVTKQTIHNLVKRRSIFKEDELYGRAVKANEKLKQYYKKWGDKDIVTDKYQVCREMFRKKKYNAKKVGIEFSVDFGNLDFPTHCPILGLELDYFSENGRQENNPSFDRKDPNKGYVNGNVYIVSWRANRIKNDGTAEEHRRISEWITK